MRYKIVFIVLILSSLSLNSQILNVENLRRVTDTSGWSGNVSLSVQLIKNKNRIFNLSNRIRAQYKQDKSLWLFINDWSFKEANSTKLVSKSTQHLRYNYKLKPRVTYEAFLQSQSDEISDIVFRGLIGTGLRFKVSKSDAFRFYIGSLVMFEHENSKVTTGNQYHNDWRASAYFSFNIRPKENISIVSTTYYQPRLDMFSDFRVSSETSIALNIVKNLAFKTTFSYNFDEFPVPGIPKEQYRLTNGIIYSFD